MVKFGEHIFDPLAGRYSCDISLPLYSALKELLHHCVLFYSLHCSGICCDVGADRAQARRTIVDALSALSAACTVLVPLMSRTQSGAPSLRATEGIPCMHWLTLHCFLGLESQKSRLWINPLRLD